MLNLGPTPKSVVHLCPVSEVYVTFWYLFISKVLIGHFRLPLVLNHRMEKKIKNSNFLISIKISKIYMILAIKNYILPWPYWWKRIYDVIIIDHIKFDHIDEARVYSRLNQFLMLNLGPMQSSVVHLCPTCTLVFLYLNYF